MINVVTDNPQETRKLGIKLSRHLKKGDIIGLCGQLGSGKTTFTKGIAQGLGVKNPEYVNSPSFVLVKEYKAKKKISLYHIDLYRLNRLKDIFLLGYQEYLYNDGIAVIEWAEKLKDLFPKEHLRVDIYIRGATKRLFKFHPNGSHYKRLLKSLKI